MKYCTLYIVRHGETVWNIEGRFQGHMDSPLTEKGKQQARELGRKLNNITFDEVFSSDLGRAKHTAELIVLEKKLAVKTTKALRERSFGKFEGKPLDSYHLELKDLLIIYNKLSAKERFSTSPTPERETDASVMSRIITFMREIAVAYKGKTVLMVSHGGAMRTLLIHLGYAKDGELVFNAVKNSAYIKLRSDGVDFFIDKVEGVERTKVSRK